MDRSSTQAAQLPRLLGARPPNHSSAMPSSSKTGGQVAERGSLQAAVSATPAPSVASTKGAISMLQEFVQCSQNFHIPPNYPVLQWNFDSQMADSATLEFRAVVAFLLEGVPHHVAGTWQLKKKDAQRDAAERALGLFVGRWSAEVLRQDGDDGPAREEVNIHGAQSAEEVLERCCGVLSIFGGVSPTWSISWTGNMCRATVEATLLDVPHKFAGSPMPTEAEAREDAARRTLWYLQQPGFEDDFEPKSLESTVAENRISAPPSNWALEASSEAALEVAERKTAIMRVQNRLQQQFSRTLRPGQSVWEWSYETDPEDTLWPPLYRASVTVPVVGRTFRGDWARGQRDAQLLAIQKVTRLLDENEAKQLASEVVGRPRAGS